MYSRLKKIKCIQSTPNTVCEACSSARLPCRFRDRERYFAERSRLVSNSSKNAAASKHHQINFDLAASPTSPTTTATAYSPQPHRTASRSSSSRSTLYHPYHHSPAQPPKSSSHSLGTPSPAPPTSSLFDDGYPTRPRAQFMMSFINTFFDHWNLWFPFIAFDETIKRFLMHDLPILQANCIAALAVRFVDIPEVVERGVVYAIDEYSSVAKASQPLCDLV